MKRNLKEPTVQEIAEEIGISKEDIVFALDAIQTPMSLQEPVYNDGGDALYVMDQLSDKKNKEEKWVEDLALEAAMEHLGEREKYIIELRFFEGKTQMEVAKEIKISQAQVSRLEKKCIAHNEAVPELNIADFSRIDLEKTGQKQNESKPGMRERIILLHLRLNCC